MKCSLHSNGKQHGNDKRAKNGCDVCTCHTLTQNGTRVKLRKNNSEKPHITSQRSTC